MFIKPITYSGVCPVQDLPVQTAAAPLLTEQQKANEIYAYVCRQFNLVGYELAQANRARCVGLPRQVAVYLILKHTTLHQQQVAAMFNRHRTTLYHQQRVIMNAMRYDAAFKARIKLFESEIRGRRTEAGGSED